jgi:hypothetical protein
MTTLIDWRKQLIKAMVLEHPSYAPTAPIVAGLNCNSYDLLEIYKDTARYPDWRLYLSGNKNICLYSVPMGAGAVFDAIGYDSIKLQAHFIVSDFALGYYIAESDNTEYYEGNILHSSIHYHNDYPGYEDLSLNIALTKRYVKVWTQYEDFDHAQMAWLGDCILSEPDHNTFWVHTKTPENYPVFKANVIAVDTDTKEVLSQSITDINGNAGLDINFLVHQKITLHGEKTIDKTVLNLTAKEISELISINADEEPNDNIP